MLNERTEALNATLSARQGETRDAPRLALILPPRRDREPASTSSRASAREGRISPKRSIPRAASSSRISAPGPAPWCRTSRTRPRHSPRGWKTPTARSCRSSKNGPAASSTVSNCRSGFFTEGLDEKSRAILGGIDRSSTTLTSGIDERVQRLLGGLDQRAGTFTTGLDENGQALHRQRRFTRPQASPRASRSRRARCSTSSTSGASSLVEKLDSAWFRTIVESITGRTDDIGEGARRQRAPPARDARDADASRSSTAMSGTNDRVRTELQDMVRRLEGTNTELQTVLGDTTTSSPASRTTLTARSARCAKRSRRRRATPASRTRSSPTR